MEVSKALQQVVDQVEHALLGFSAEMRFDEHLADRRLRCVV